MAIVKDEVPVTPLELTTRPNIFVRERTWRLEDDAITWTGAAGSGRVAFADIDHARIFWTPGFGAMQGFGRTVLHPRQGERIILQGGYYRGLGRVEDRAAAYAPFADAALRKVVAANPRATIIRGIGWPLWIFWLAILIVAPLMFVFALAVLIEGEFPLGAVIYLGIVAAFLPAAWKVAVRDGPPRALDPAALPARLVL